MMLCGVADRLGNKGAKKESEKLDLIKEILSLRLEGRCSIISISRLLIRKGYGHTSIGYISELLSGLGSELSPLIVSGAPIHVMVVFASDEVYAKQKPILITVDPCSSAILCMEQADDRGRQSWQEHWQSLLEQGIMPLYLTNDEGRGMRSASDTTLEGVARQSDSFHALAHRLGPVCWTLERQAYQAIDWEYERQRVLQSAKSKRVRAKRKRAYKQAVAEAKRRMELYDNFHLIYQMMIECLQVFDRNGQVRQASQAQKDLETAMEWMEDLGCQKANEQLVVIKGLVPSLFHFLEYGLQVVQTLEGSLKTEWKKQAFKIVCKAWQCRKNMLKAKKGAIKKYYRLKHLYWLELGAKVFEQSQSGFETFQKRIYKSLDSIVQSSAMVETINSIIRLYLNDCKNQVTQPQLNLIRFYHNHRKYVQGKRKGFSPMELLTGQKQDEDWLDLLLQKLKIAA